MAGRRGVRDAGPYEQTDLAVTTLAEAIALILPPKLPVSARIARQEFAAERQTALPLNGISSN